MDLGVKNGTVRILEHDPKWADEASRMINHLKTFLTGDDFLDFEHVGSTAIKGIPAKPIVDIAVAIKDESVVEKYKDIMLENGFTFLGKVTDDQKNYKHRNEHRSESRSVTMIPVLIIRIVGIIFVHNFPFHVGQITSLLYKSVTVKAISQM